MFFFKQKTAYEMRISDWSSDVCSSDLYSTTLFAGTLPNTSAPCDTLAGNTMRLSCALGAGVGAVCEKAGGASNRPTNAIIPAKKRTRRFRGNDGRTCNLPNGGTTGASAAVTPRIARRPTTAGRYPQHRQRREGQRLATN